MKIDKVQWFVSVIDLDMLGFASCLLTCKNRGTSVYYKKAFSCHLQWENGWVNDAIHQGKDKTERGYD